MNGWQKGVSMTRVEFAESNVKLSFEVDLHQYPGAEDQVVFRLQAALRKAVAEEMTLAVAALTQSLDKADADAMKRFSSPFNTHDTDWAQVITNCQQQEAERKAAQAAKKSAPKALPPAEGSLEWLKARSAAEPHGSYMFNEYTVFDLDWPWEGRNVRVVVSSEEHILAAQRALRLLIILQEAGVVTPEQLERLLGQNPLRSGQPESRTALESPEGTDHAQ